MAPRTPHTGSAQLLLRYTWGRGRGSPRIPPSHPKVCSLNRRPQTMLPRSCSEVEVFRAEHGSPSRPEGGNRARPAGGGVRRNNRPEPAPPARRRQPLPERGGPPHATYAASPRLRLGQPLTPAWRPLPAPGLRPRRPERSPSLAPPRRGPCSGGEGGGTRPGAPPTTSGSGCSNLNPGSHRGASGRLQRACVLTCSARGPAGG